MSAPTQDIWIQWLLDRRFGGDRDLMQRVLTSHLYPIRDRVLDHASLQDGETLLDVGCGDGLIAFGALERVKSCRVIFSDISQDLLDHDLALAKEMDLIERCRFLPASADDLSALEDGSVDVVTTRSVLIYVKDKQKAFDQFFRMLKPGGRLSIFEPINRFAFPEPRRLFDGYDISPVIEIADKIKAIYDHIQPMDDPMLDFDERDLIGFAEKTGFKEVHLELRVDVEPYTERIGWETYIRQSGNPKIPTLEEAMQQTLRAEEAAAFSAHLHPLVEGLQGARRSAVAYLWVTRRE